MGRAHSNAWRQVTKFFDPPFEPVLQVVCGRDVADLQAFADRWGWAETETDWHRIVERDDIDIVDIGLPTHLHAETAIAAARSGKHVFCEKPIALNLAEAEAMLAAAEQAGVVHYLNHNYRRCPAVALARQLVESGEIGEIFHWRGAYQQSWLINPDHPIDWKLRKATAGAGPLWDLGSHAVDLAHHLVGDIASVSCQMKNFIGDRPLADRPGERGPVEVECAATLMMEFANGAFGSVETTRYATGRRNRHTFELYGSKGALAWDMEDMNRLRFYREGDPAEVRGFRDILVTERCHEYVNRWWPPGHIIGYEHAFVHAAADFLAAISGQTESESGGEGVEPARRAGSWITPDFRDGVRITRVLEGAAEAANSGRRVVMG